MDGFDPYLNMVWTDTIVLQSDSVSSSAELENSLLTTTTLSARVIPALIKSSRLRKKQKVSCQTFGRGGRTNNSDGSRYQSIVPSIQ